METILTIIPGTVMGSKMGRPPLNVVETKVRLPKGAAERIDALMGPNKRAEFIREAVETELRRREGAGED